MFSNKDSIYLQTKDIPNLKSKIDNAINLSRELALTLSDLEAYQLEFKIKEEREEQ